MAISGPTNDHQEIRNWAEARSVVPTEQLPHVLDSEPAVLRMMLAAQAKGHPDIKVISWEELFVKFDGLGLTFVYADDSTGYNEILQIEDRSPTAIPSIVLYEWTISSRILHPLLR